MAEKQASQILHILQQSFTIPDSAVSKNDSFKTLIATIISQNTTDKNTARAFENLSNHFEITPEALAKAEDNQIEESLKVAGLYKNKSKSIKQISKIIQKKYHGTLNPILSLPLEKARNALIDLPGVGPKTADVVLLFAANQPTIPVDTHVNRLAKRLGFAPANANYETVRQSLQSLFKTSDYSAIHLLLIAHGREYCKARRPMCNECPISLYCPSKGTWNKP